MAAKSKVPVTASADALHLRAKLAAAERLVRKGDTQAALRLLGLIDPREKTDGVKPGGRRGHTARERQRIVGLYENMTTAPGPCRPQYARSPERLDLLLEHSARWIEHASGTPWPELPDEAVFVPDRNVPMGREDALRNVAAYMGVSRAQAWKILNQESQALVRSESARLDLPPRDLPTRRK